MRHNKVLNAAIATALAMGVSASYAGQLQIFHVLYDGNTGPTGATTATLKEGMATYASEFFLQSVAKIPDAGNYALAGATDNDFHNSGSDGAAAVMVDAATAPNNNYFYAVYTFESSVNEEFLAKFELSNGATLGQNISLNSTTLDFVAHPSGSHIAATTSGAFGAANSQGDSLATFLVQPGGSVGSFTANSTLVLRFTLANTEKLKTAGEEIRLSVNIFDKTGTFQADLPAPSAAVVTSRRGASINLRAATGLAQIDVSTNNLNFTGNVYSPTSVSLGEIAITSASTYLRDTHTPWRFAIDQPTPGSATLTITEAPFSASLASPGKVFLDIDGNKIYTAEYDMTTATGDYGADTVETDTAIWDLDDKELAEISARGTVDIIVAADGVTEISDFREAPQAILVVDYGSGNVDTYTGRLRHIKRNGTVCTLYNVPNPAAIDVGNIRITNKTGLEGKVMGTLRAVDGSSIFTNQTLVEALAPNETVRLTQDNLDQLPKDQTWLDAGNAESGWPGRAVLTISSNLTDMEVFGLVRNAAGGPLTNMSSGASGNGCE